MWCTIGLVSNLKKIWMKNAFDFHLSRFTIIQMQQNGTVNVFGLICVVIDSYYDIFDKVSNIIFYGVVHLLWWSKNHG
jgi:hypothetical protein